MGSSRSTIKVPDEQWTWNIAFHNHNNWWLEQLLNLNLWWLVLFRLAVSMFFIPETYIAVKFGSSSMGAKHAQQHQLIFQRTNSFLISSSSFFHEIPMILPWYCHIYVGVWSPFFRWFPMVSYGFIMKISPMKSPMKSRSARGALGAQKKFAFCSRRLWFGSPMTWRLEPQENHRAWASQDRCLPSGKLT
jgi:hypothetical protein